MRRRTEKGRVLDWELGGSGIRVSELCALIWHVRRLLGLGRM